MRASQAVSITAEAPRPQNGSEHPETLGEIARATGLTQVLQSHPRQSGGSGAMSRAAPDNGPTLRSETAPPVRAHQSEALRLSLAFAADVTATETLIEN